MSVPTPFHPPFQPGDTVPSTPIPTPFQPLFLPTPLYPLGLEPPPLAGGSQQQKPPAWPQNRASSQTGQQVKRSSILTSI